ncbi:MAG TPA: BON domain-containing protein [Usitatibacter sp.]|nr:BON domain-containing protein [Usitatibacter sp.]
MNRMLPLAAVMVAAAIAAGCDRPRTNTAYNNSGTDATPMEPSRSATGTATTTGNTGTTSNPPGGTGATASSAPATADTASANVASRAPAADNAPAGNASGAVSETVTTGKIKAAIAADSAMKDSDISVTTKDGVVTLSGTVKSQDQVAIATNLAQRQEGVQRVESNIQVR